MQTNHLAFFLVVLLVSIEWIRCASVDSLREASESGVDSNKLSLDQNLTDISLPSVDRRVLDNIARAMVFVTNKYRNCHGVSALQRDSSLDSEATNWANIIASKNQLMHSGNGFGENLYFRSNPLSPNGKEPVQAWYCECFNRYDYSSENNQLSCGHFTQLVWKSSEKIGVGIAQGSDGFYVVANFDPAGNFRHEYTENVFQPDMRCVNSVGSC